MAAAAMAAAETTASVEGRGGKAGMQQSTAPAKTAEMEGGAESKSTQASHATTLVQRPGLTQAGAPNRAVQVRAQTVQMAHPVEMSSSLSMKTIRTCCFRSNLT